MLPCLLACPFDLVAFLLCNGIPIPACCRVCRSKLPHTVLLDSPLREENGAFLTEARFVSLYSWQLAFCALAYPRCCCKKCKAALVLGVTCLIALSGNGTDIAAMSRARKQVAAVSTACRVPVTG